jgi:hypothetical protein
MCLSSILGGGGSADKIAKAQRADETARQNRVTQGMSSIANIFGAFNDDFYNKRAADYQAYAMPEVDRQSDQQRKGLIYALARTGNLDSSAASDKAAELQQEVNKQRIGVANEGLNQANALRGQVENTRGNVVAELNATGDSEAAANSALRQSQALNQPAGFSPLGNLFLNFADTVSRIGSRASNGYSGFIGGGGAPIFSASNSAQRVVRG